MFELPVNQKEEDNQVVCNLTLTEFPFDFEDFKTLQSQDPELRGIKERLTRGEQVDRYVIARGALYWRTRCQPRLLLVVPEAARVMLFAYFHDSAVGGHLGVKKTIKKIGSHFTWKGMNQQIQAKVEHVKYAHIVNRHKPPFWDYGRRRWPKGQCKRCL
jgi:hypothetical protein